MTTLDRPTGPRPGVAGAEGREPSVLLIGYALAGGMVAWALHLWAVTSLVPTACADDVTWVMHLVTAATGLAAAGAIVASIRMGRLVSSPAARNGRTRMLAILATIVDVASLSLIVLEAIPIAVISPCKVA